MAVRRRKLPALVSPLLAGVAFAAAPLPPVAGKIGMREAVDRALKANLGLAISRDDFEISEAGVETAKAVFDPIMSVSTGFDRFQTAGASYIRRGDVGTAWTNNASLTQKFEYGTQVTLSAGVNPNISPIAIASPDIYTQTGITIRQPLTRGAGKEVNLAPIARARLNVSKARVNMRIAAADLIRDTEVAYRTLAASHSLLLIRESSLAAAESLLHEIKVRRRPDIGTATEQDEIEAAAEVAARNVDITSARGRLDAAADDLRRLLGEAPSRSADQPAPEVAPLSANPAPTETFAKFMNATDTFNPEAELRDLDVRDAEIAYMVANDATNPALDMYAGASTIGRGNTFESSINGQWYRNGSDLNAGFTLTVPLGNRERDANLRIARRQREQARYRMADTRRVVGYAARAAWRDLVSARARVSVAATGVEIQTRAYAGTRARNANGLASVNDVLIAASRLDQAKLTLLNATLDLAVADARRARLDGSILSRNGLRWEDVDDNAATATADALDLEALRD